MRDMLHIGAPIFAELFLVSLFVMVDTALLKPCGTTAFAAYRILISLQNFAYLGAEAVATTALILMSKAYANHDRKAAQDAFSAAMVYGIAFSSLCAVLFFTVPSFLMSCYSDDPQVLSEGVRVLRIIFLYQPFQAVALIYASVRVFPRSSRPWASFWFVRRLSICWPDRWACAVRGLPL